MSLSYSNVKTFKPVRGIRQAIIDITLDDSYDDGGWSIAGEDLLNYSGIASVIYNLIPPASKNGYDFEWVPVSGNVTGLLKASKAGVSDTFIGEAMAEFTAYPTGTFTEQAAALCQVYNSTAGLYSALDSTDDLDDATAAYQPWPDADSEAVGDMVYFAGAVPFAQIAFTITTGAVYGAAASVGWEYYNEDGSWDSLMSAIITDTSGSSAIDGTYSFEQTGTMTFVPPQDWGSTTINSQAGYWIRCKLLKAQVTTTAVFTSEHDLNVLTTGYVPTHNGLITSVRITDTSDVAHTANDIEFILYNEDTGASSGVCAFAQDKTDEVIPLTYPVPVSIDDKLSIIVTQEDGTNEFDSGFITFNYSKAEALADDAALNGVVLRCQITGS